MKSRAKRLTQRRKDAEGPGGQRSEVGAAEIGSQKLGGGEKNLAALRLGVRLRI
jgi:hypothetical protein